MKILVANLLRLGDVISMAPALRAIRRQNPGAKIHLLVNNGVEQATRILPDFEKVHIFERDRLQQGLIDANRPMFESFDVLSDFVDQLGEENYDLLINFTHNRLSGWLCGLLPAKRKIGLALDGAGGVSFGSAWFRHLNQQVDFEEAQSFNHSDVFFASIGGLKYQRDNQTSELGLRDSLLSETEAGREEANALLRTMFDGARGPAGSHPAGSILAIQLSTSDEKKEWGDSRFRALAETVLRSHADLKIAVLGAPSERERIDKFCRSIEGDASRVHSAILSIAGVLSFLEETNVLVTGDTSIKHVASAASVVTIELAVGSADPFRTGSWKEGDLVVAGREACRPCGHSEKCHRDTHACASAIPVEDISLIVSSILLNESRSVLRARSRRMDKCDIYEVDRTEGLAQLVALNGIEGFSDRNLALSLERTARRLSLEMKDGRLDRMSMGTEIRLAKYALKRKFAGVSNEEFRHALSGGELKIRHAAGIVRSLRLQLDRLRESIQDPKRSQELIWSIAALRTRLTKNPWTYFVAEPLMAILEDDRSAPFTKYRRTSDSVSDLEVRIEMTLKIVRGLEIEFENEDTLEDRV